MVLSLSDLVSTQLPEFVREQYPRFLAFVKYYYREQERTGNSLDIVNNYVKYFDVNYQNYGSSANSILVKSIDEEETQIECSGIDLFPLEDGYIKINDEIIFYDVREDQILKNCKRGRTYKDSLVVGNYKDTIPSTHSRGSVVYDISNLFLEVILSRFQEQLLNNFPYDHIINSVDKRQIIKYIKDFYVSKGTKDSLKFIFSILLESKDDELDRYAPKDFIYRLSNSDYEDSYGIYVKLISGDISSLEGEVLRQENSDFSVPIDSIRNQGNGIYKILIDELEYNGNFDFNEDLIYDTVRLRPIAVLDTLSLSKSNPYCKIGQKLEFQNVVSKLPIDFEIGNLYENDNNYFLDIDGYIHTFSKNPSFFSTGKIVDKNIGVFVDGTPIRSYFGDEVQYGYITEIELIDKGFGYSSPPYVLIDYEPNIANAILVGNVIDRIELDRNFLRNYRENVPLIEIITGRNALVNPIITDGRITSLVIEEEGEYYSESPDIVIQDLEGKGRDAIYKSIISSDGRLIGVEKISEGLLYSNSTEVFVIPIANKTQAIAKAKLSSFNKVFRSNIPIDLLVKYDDNFKNNMLERANRLKHSPILGIAYDGNPIYGPYGYDNPFEVSDIRLMETGWKLKNSLNVIRPIGERGEFVEDYEYDYDWSHLDICNGRFCVTPEFPNGVYAYFLSVTYDENSSDQLDHKYKFPYVIGERFYSRPSIQLSGIKLSQIIGIKKVEDNYVLNNFIAKVSQISSGSIDGFDIGISGNNFKLGDRLVFENNRNLNVIVSEIRKGEIDNIIFDYGVLINTEDNVYIDASPISSEYFSSDSSSIEVLFDTNNGNKLLGRISGEIEDKVFIRTSANTEVFVELTTNKNSFFTSGSILSFYDERGNRSTHSSVYEVVESVSNSDKVIIKFSVLDKDKQKYIDDHDKYLQDSFNYGSFIRLRQENILIRSSNPDDSQDSIIRSYRDLSFQFKAISVGDSFGISKFKESHGIGLGQEIQFGGSIIGRKKFIVYLNNNGKISFKDNEGIVVEGEDIYFYKGIDYLLELEENIGYLDFTYHEDVSIPIYLPEIIRVNVNQIIVRFNENTQYGYLYFFDRDNIQQTFRNKILVTESPLSGNIIAENSTDKILAFLLNKEIKHFPSDGDVIEDLEDVRNIKKIINELDSSDSNTFLSFYHSYITVGNPTPTQIGQINNIRILGGNNELFNLPSVIGVENQTISYIPQYVNGELSSFGSIKHEKPFKSPLAILYVGNRYIDGDDIQIIVKDGYVTNILLKESIIVKGDIELKIVESDVELYPYSNSIGNVIDVDNNYEYDVPNDINRLPIIKTSNVYVLEGKNNFNLGDSIKLKDGKFTESFVIDIQGNNVVTISNSNFSVGDIIVNQNLSESVVKSVIWNEFSPSITNHIDIIESNMGLGWGHIGENTQRIQDGKFYQDHSYVVRSQNDISEWRNYVTDTIHPVGFELFGELYQKYNNDVEVNSIESHVIYNFNYDIGLDVNIDIEKKDIFYIDYDIFNEYDLTIERGSGAISTSGGIDDIGMILVDIGNEIKGSGKYELLGENNRSLRYTPLDVLIYSINGVFVDVLQFEDEITYPQTLDLSKNWKEENDFYGLGFLKDDNPRYNQKLKNIFQRKGRWLDAANLIELNIDNLLDWVISNTEIITRNYYNRESILKFRIFIESVVFGVRFGGNNKVFEFFRDNPEMTEDLNSIIELIVLIVQRNKDEVTSEGKLKQFKDLEHIPRDTNLNVCDNVVQYINGLIDCSVCSDPDFINNETTEFDLFWDDGSNVVLSENEDLFIIVDGILQVPNESYVIDKTGETSKIIFSRPLKWQQTKADRLANVGLNINTFMGYNLNPYYVLDLERYGDNQWILVDSVTKVKRQINYPLAVLMFIDGVLQKYGAVYTIEDSIVTFIDDSILIGRNVHIRYLYDKDINIDHYIHDYWSDKYFAKATVFIPYIESVGDLFEFIKTNENKLIYMFQGDLRLGRVTDVEYSEEALGLYVKILSSFNVTIDQDKDFEFKLYNPGSLHLSTSLK